MVHTVRMLSAGTFVLPKQTMTRGIWEATPVPWPKFCGFDDGMCVWPMVQFYLYVAPASAGHVETQLIAGVVVSLPRQWHCLLSKSCQAI
jgi:hypothetical protein